MVEVTFEILDTDVPQEALLGTLVLCAKFLQHKIKCCDYRNMHHDLIIMSGALKMLEQWTQAQIYSEKA